MSGRTSIEWTDRTWNPTRGCSMAAGSECGGCLNCYAARQGLRMAGKGGKYEGLVKLTPNGPRWTGKVVPGDLDAPLHVRAPSRWFVDSMSDLFHESIPDEWIDRAFAVMALCPQHTFQVLTKRAERMHRYFKSDTLGRDAREHIYNRAYALSSIWQRAVGSRFPLENVWLGVSVEDEPTARLRIPFLLATPAALWWVSYEPALGPVDWTSIYLDETGGWMNALYPGKDGNRPESRIGWLVIGGESGPGARPFDLAWARNAIAQCRAAGVPPFFKQAGARPFGFREGSKESSFTANSRVLVDRKGGDMAEWPEDLRIREYPR